MITKEQFAEWKSHPVTIDVFKEVEDARNKLKERLSEGLTICYDAEATHGSTSRMVGVIEGLNQLLNITYEDAEEESAEDL
jgi:hypothetical protein